ncbi:hypothetical protein NE237_009221 [Protea cynaroides]|uniref:Uncharacterized protein n=1 Tax=Protea cynaroides TaxID=273540 RepID=A0A9Q0KY73_9MAGN|nr:hypothetical protein NE237_009221 [Protea cynaroides]
MLMSMDLGKSMLVMVEDSGGVRRGSSMDWGHGGCARYEFVFWFEFRSEFVFSTIESLSISCCTVPLEYCFVVPIHLLRLHQCPSSALLLQISGLYFVIFFCSEVVSMIFAQRHGVYVLYFFLFTSLSCKSMVVLMEDSASQCPPTNSYTLKLLLIHHLKQSFVGNSFEM